MFILPDEPDLHIGWAARIKQLQGNESDAAQAEMRHLLDLLFSRRHPPETNAGRRALLTVLADIHGIWDLDPSSWRRQGIEALLDSLSDEEGGAIHPASISNRIDA